LVAPFVSCLRHRAMLLSPVLLRYLREYRALREYPLMDSRFITRTIP
jgi:hypothetical protein